MADPWPAAWNALAAELRAGRETFAAVDCASPLSDMTLTAIAEVADTTIDVGAQLTAGSDPASPDGVLESAAGPTLLTHLEVLFTPVLGIDLLAQLRRTARKVPLVVAWPGRVDNGRLTYSAPGRGDRLDAPLRNVLVLRPVHTEFPDEVPYVVERFPS